MKMYAIKVLRELLEVQLAIPVQSGAENKGLNISIAPCL